MALTSLTDATVARRLLERAVAAGTNPALTPAEVTDLMALAASLAADGVTTVYTGADLNIAASTGWQWKAGKVAGDFSVSLEGGMKFAREQVYAHCIDMANEFGSGQRSVLGSSLAGGRGGIRSIGLVSSLGTGIVETL